MATTPFIEEALDGRGDGLVATIDLPVGTPVISRRPDVAVLYSDVVSSYCGSCFETMEIDDGPSWSCADCGCFSLCRGCSASGQIPPSAPTAREAPSPALREWHVSGECAAFLAVDPKLRSGDTDYLRWMLRYFDFLERGPAPRVYEPSCRHRAGDSSVDDDGTEADEEATSGKAEGAEERAAATDAAAPVEYPPSPATGFGDTRATPVLSDPFASLVGNEPEQTEEFKGWARGFARLFMAHTNPPEGVTEEDLFALLLRIQVNALGFPFSIDSTLGWCLDGQVSKLNHSCSPNCAVNSSAANTASTTAAEAAASSSSSTVSDSSSSDSSSSSSSGSPSSSDSSTVSASSPSNSGVDTSGSLSSGSLPPPPPVSPPPALSSIPSSSCSVASSAAASASSAPTPTAGGPGHSSLKLKLKGALEVRTTKAVAASQELTISYLDLSDPSFSSVAARRRSLLEKYLFHCTCARCVREEQELGEHTQESPPLSSLPLQAAGSRGAAAPSAGAGLTQVSVEVPEGATAGTELSVGVEVV